MIPLGGVETLRCDVRGDCRIEQQALRGLVKREEISPANDLFYRQCHVVRVELPPTARSAREDIYPLLVDTSWRDTNRHQGAGRCRCVRRRALRG